MLHSSPKLILINCDRFVMLAMSNRQEYLHAFPLDALTGIVVMEGKRTLVMC